MLTREEKLNALYAMALDGEAKTERESIELTLRNNAWEEAYGDEGQFQRILPIVRERYEMGKRVLEAYNVTYSGRNTTGLPDPANADDWIVVDSGHIATSQAYRTARFYKKS